MSLYSSQAIEKTIPEGCPWHQAQETYGTPNVDWCEPTICAWVNEPANTWSNLGFILIGLLILKKFSKRPLIKKYSYVVMIMGLFSGIYHATNNYLSQHLDFLGMSLFLSFIITFEWMRATGQKSKSFMTYFWFFLATNMTLLIFLGVLKVPIQLLIMLNAVPIILIESYIAIKLKKRKPLIYFVTSLITLFLAQVAAQIDLKRIYCVPTNTWLHGHVIWHFLCALATGIIAFHLFYRENELD